MSNKIIEKIQKLLNLATSSNVNEAAVAAAAAQKLMTEHRISIAELEGHATNGVPAVVIVKEELSREKSMIPWKSRLASGLAKANGCEMYHARHADHVATMYVGPESGLATMKYMYQYLIREIDRLASLERQKGHADRTYLTSFRYGAASMISERLNQANAQAMTKASGAALAVINKGEEGIKAVMSQLTLKKSQTKLNDRQGYEAGREAGKSVSLGSGKALGKGSEQLKG